MRGAALVQRAGRIVQEGLCQQIFHAGSHGRHGVRSAGRQEGHVGDAHLGEDPPELVLDHVRKCPRHKERGHRAGGWKGGEGYQRG